jgi:hypothetical protein
VNSGATWHEEQPVWVLKNRSIPAFCSELRACLSPARYRSNGESKVSSVRSKAAIALAMLASVIPSEKASVNRRRYSGMAASSVSSAG